jgi:phenylpropionate dioxygenase-like ring-hydroxylating dioxygenase large terminal subunit
MRSTGLRTKSVDGELSARPTHSGVHQLVQLWKGVHTVTTIDKRTARSDEERMGLTWNDVDRLTAYAAANTTYQVPDVLRVPIELYGPERFEVERREVFLKVPLALGFSFDLPGAHSYRTQDMLGIPLVLTRDADGKFHAFLNVCSHRGVCVVKDDFGTAPRFRCGYHGWTFSSDDGHLVSLSAHQKFGEIDRSQYGLVELPTEERHGILWGTLTPGAHLDLDSWLGPMDPVLSSFELDTCFAFGRDTIAAGNWKAVMDGYLEQYHNPYLHPETRAYFANDTSFLKTLGRHEEYTFASAKIKKVSSKPREDWNILELASKALFLFPNTVLGVNFPADDLDLPGMQFAAFRIVPGETFEHSTTLLDVFSSRPAETAAQVAALQARVEETSRVLREEDYPTVNSQMKGWKSGALTHMTYGRQEATAQIWLHAGLEAEVNGTRG